VSSAPRRVAHHRLDPNTIDLGVIALRDVTVIGGAAGVPR
jgi:hypothetical protein